MPIRIGYKPLNFGRAPRFAYASEVTKSSKDVILSAVEGPLLLR